MSLSEFSDKVAKMLVFHALRHHAGLKTLSESHKTGSLQREPHGYRTCLHPLAEKKPGHLCAGWRERHPIGSRLTSLLRRTHLRANDWYQLK
jgi:hypothetical protein